MRTTLTIDDDLAGILQRRAHELGKPFKEMVNNALRKGLQDEKNTPEHQIVTRPTALGLRAGIDPNRMNQLNDELEVDVFLKKEGRR